MLAASSAGCFRFSDPIYATKDVRALEPEEEGMSLIFGTILVDDTMADGLASVTLEKIGPGAERSYVNTNNVNMFRVFFRRTMKNGNFLMELRPGLYEVIGFSTGLQIWTVKESARKAMRILVTRPGIYDIGLIRVSLASRFGDTYDMELVSDRSPEREAVLAKAIAGTTWERVAARQTALAAGAAPPPSGASAAR